MGSQGGGAVEEAKLQPFGRQGSFYSLTLDEVQTELGDLGKPLGSMNLDELLKNITQDNEVPCSSSMHRQGSLTLSRDLIEKTVDQVWRDIQQKNNNEERKANQRQPTFGEMTLEDFLVEAGVVSESSLPLGNNNSAIPEKMVATTQENTRWTQFQLPSVQQPPHQPNMMAVFMPGHPIQSLPVLDPPYPETQMALSPSSLIGNLSDTQTPGRKRVAPRDVVGRTVERRQKRMIKNRESAARSRARKQAYTQELEIKVSCLEAENERLRRQQKVEKILPCAPLPEPKRQLRRTNSSPM